MPDSRPLTFLCVTTYEKGQEFMRECKRQGCGVILLTAEKLKNANWPRESIDETFYLPEDIPIPDIVKAVAHLSQRQKIDRIVALDEFDMETAATLREHMRIPGMGLTTSLHPDFGTVWNGAPNGIPYIAVAGNQAPVPINFMAVGSQSDPGPYPVPADAPVEGGANGTGDRHVLVIDRDNWTIGETVVKSPPFPTKVLRSLEDPGLGGAYDPNDPPYWPAARGRLRGWHLSEGALVEQLPDARGWLWSAELASWLAPDGPLMRLYDDDGRLRLTEGEAERVAKEAERAAKETERSAKEAAWAKLRELGIDPQSLYEHDSE